MTSLLHIFFLLFVLILSSCSSHKELTTQSAIESEVARSDITVTDVDTDLSSLVNRNIVVTLKDVVVEYDSPGDSVEHSNASVPKIRSPGRDRRHPSAIRAGEIILSDKSQEATNLLVSDNSVQSFKEDSNTAAVAINEEKSDSKCLWPDYWLLTGSLCLSATCIVVVLIVLYRKGKLRL